MPFTHLFVPRRFAATVFAAALALLAHCSSPEAEQATMPATETDSTTARQTDLVATSKAVAKPALPDFTKHASSPTANGSAQTMGMDTAFAAYMRTQDSLRAVLLAQKPNEALKNSMLCELYLRDLVETDGATATVSIPFNLHSNDCGAPDCYTTQVTFDFPLTNPLAFPESLTMHLHESGCFGPERNVSSTFFKAEETANFIRYYSDDWQASFALVVFGNSADTDVWFFENVPRNHLSAAKAQHYCRDLAEGDTALAFPYGTTLMTAEYEYFLAD